MKYLYLAKNIFQTNKVHFKPPFHTQSKFIRISGLAEKLILCVLTDVWWVLWHYISTEVIVYIQTIRQIWQIYYSCYNNILHVQEEVVDQVLIEIGTLWKFSYFSFYPIFHKLVRLYVQKVVTKPKILNRTILSNITHVT